MPKTPRKKKNGVAAKKASAAEDAAGAPHSSSQELAAELSSMLKFGAGDDAQNQKALLSAAAREEMPELLTSLKQLRQRIGSLKSAADAALDRFAPTAGTSSSSTDGPPVYVEMKVQVLLSYLIGLVYYLRLKAQGVPLRDHTVALRLVWARTLLEKLKPVDQRLQYQISRALKWTETSGKKAADDDAVDAHALKPGELALGVEDEDGEDGEQWGANDEDGIYRPPRTAQVEYTGDHITAADKAEKELDRKRTRLERSDFMRELRAEFTDAPAEVHGRIQSKAAETASRKLAEQQEYEEENMVRLRSGKADTKAQKRLLKQTYVDAGAGGGGMSLDDATDFRELSSAIASEAAKARGKGKKGKGKRRGTPLQEYQDAMGRANSARDVVDSTLGGGAPSTKGGGKRKGGGKSGGKGKRQRK